MYWSKGIWFMILAGFFFSVMNVCVKLLAHIPPVEIVFFRSVISLILCVTMLKWQGISLWGSDKKYLFLRGIAGAFALILYFELMHRVPLASAVTIGFLAPLFAAFFGIFIVNERVHPVQWLFYFISFTGILLVKGFDARISIYDFMIGIGASAFTGLAHNFVRKIKTSEHPLVIIFYFPLVTIPVTGVFSAVHWVMPENFDWILLLAVGVFTQIAQLYMTKAYQNESISKVTNLQYLNIIYALIFGFFIFQETFNWITFLGMLLAVSGVVFNLVYKKNNSDKVQSVKALK